MAVECEDFCVAQIIRPDELLDGKYLHGRKQDTQGEERFAVIESHAGVENTLGVHQNDSDFFPPLLVI